MNHKNDTFWTSFLAALAAKTKSPNRNPSNLEQALENAREKPAIEIAIGIHGNILFQDAGYFEFDDVEHAWRQLGYFSAFVKEGRLPIGFEIGTCSLEILARQHPVWDLLRDARVEIINPLYAQPFLRLCGDESNVRQFQRGLHVLRKHGLSCKVFASSEHALHPQVPQLLHLFDIPLVYAVARLSGGAPTSYHPGVSWFGLDGTSIPAIVAQSGLPNGHVWHGKFFDELPGLIFHAVARPDLDIVAYTNIEDFANGINGTDTIAEHVHELERNNIFFKPFMGIAGSPAPPSRSVSWTIDDFPVRQMESKLVHIATVAEHHLVNYEAACSLLSESGYPCPWDVLDGAWQKLLIAQNHDAFVVPLTTPGLYSKQQGLDIAAKWNINETIEERCTRLAREAINEARGTIERTANARILEEGTAIPDTHAVVNWLWKRQSTINGKTYEIPAFGICKLVEATHARELATTQEERDFIINDLEIKFENCTTTMNDQPTFLEARVNAGKKAVLRIAPVNEVHVSYPFGAGCTTAIEGHSSRFLWINGAVAVMHDGTPYFKRRADVLEISIQEGLKRFGFSKATTLLEAYRNAWEFCYPPVLLDRGFAILSNTFHHEINFQGCIPTSIQWREKHPFARLLSVDGSLPEIKGAVRTTIDGKPTETDDTNCVQPFTILHFILA